ncbi:MAG: DNA repair protein RecO [Candidatus Adlerbacteria bacterium]|nr:DNA repair protein RecO [Candidatus Adlerbacteria bacterium]
MHTIVATDGIVLGKRGIGEANTSIFLLTKDVGLVRASARSARVEHSKLRYGLEPLTQGRFAMLRGRYEWKLTGVEQLSRAYFGQTLLQRRASGRVARLLLRLINGEEPVPELYTTVRGGFAYMAGGLDEAEIENAECVLVLRVLSHLGYLEQTEISMPFVANNEFSPTVTTEARALRPALIRVINESLGASGL